MTPRMKTKTLLPLLLLGCAVLAALLLAGPGDGKAPRAPERFIAELRVGYAHEPPYAFRDAGGEITGEAPLACSYVARELGVRTVRFVLMSFGSLVDELEAGTIDVIAAGMFVTPERAARVRFSVPTAQVGQGLLVRLGNPHGVHSYEAAVANGVCRIAVLDGAVEQKLLAALGMPLERLYVCQDVETALSALRHGRVEGVALSGPSVRWLARGFVEEMEAAHPFSPPQLAGFKRFNSCALGFRHTDGDLAEAFDAVLRGYVTSPARREAILPLGFGPQNIPEAGP